MEGLCTIVTMYGGRGSSTAGSAAASKQRRFGWILRRVRESVRSLYLFTSKESGGTRCDTIVMRQIASSVIKNYNIAEIRIMFGAPTRATCI